MLTPFLLITSLQAKQFHALTHSFAQLRAAIPYPSNSLRTLSIATGVAGYQRGVFLKRYLKERGNGIETNGLR